MTARPRQKNKTSFYANGGRRVKAHISSIDTGLPVHTVDIEHYAEDDFVAFLKKHHADTHHKYLQDKTRQTKTEFHEVERKRREFETSLAVKELLVRASKDQSLDGDKREVVLKRVNLKGVIIEDFADAKNVDLFIIESDLNDAKINNTQLGNLSIQDSQAVNAEIRGSSARHVWLTNSNFLNANISDNSFRGEVNFEKSNFKDATMHTNRCERGVSIRKANLQGATVWPFVANCKYSGLQKTPHFDWAGAKFGDGTKPKGSLPVAFYTAVMLGNVGTALENAGTAIGGFVSKKPKRALKH